jgi:arylsulfatase A
MFVTGKYNFRNYKEWGVLNPSERTFGNLLKGAGYATYVAGKWQLDGGDASIRGFGFGNYSLWNPLKDEAPGSHYKNPKIYEHGSFLPKEATVGKYGDDIFTDSVLSFIQKNKSRNFFVWFPITLCHFPYCPTPNDSAFKKWDPKGNPSDTKYFPSMIKYMDKKIGQIIDSLKAWKLYNNTILMFVGDNGTPHHIFYYYNGVLTEGGKSNSTEAGTHVTMIVTWPNKITSARVNRNLVDFTDFLPTFADAAGISIPSDYGIIDGHSFYGQLAGVPNTPRDWIFCHYQPNTNNGNDKLKRWTQDTTYKLYDSTGNFYNIISDPLEKDPIKRSQMTPHEKQIAKTFQSIMDTLK